jgi:hypothetical protein
MRNNFRTNKLRGTLDKRMKILTTVDSKNCEPPIPQTAKIEVNTKLAEMNNSDFRFYAEKLRNSRVIELGITGYDTSDTTIPYKIQSARSVGFDNIYMTVKNLYNVGKFLNSGLTSLSVKCDKDDIVKFTKIVEFSKLYPDCEFSIFLEKEEYIDDVYKFVKPLNSKIKVYYKPNLVVHKEWKLFNCIHIDVEGYIVPSFENRYKKKKMGRVSNKIIDIWNSLPFVDLRFKNVKFL